MLYPKQHLRVFFVLTPSKKNYAVNAIKKGVYTDEGANGCAVRGREEGWDRAGNKQGGEKSLNKKVAVPHHK